MYIADLHIHSRYSRATSLDLTPEQLDLWARRKGIDLVGTGDFTHPAWRQELREKLVPAEEGLYALKDELTVGPGAAGSRKPRFVISGEISSIYKKYGKVRKVHNVILLPGLEEADLLAKKLETIGNIHSDGRPILGLDSRDLLEITLEICPRAIFVPAHIWTPHFSLFGAFSGFDRMEECFEDLTPYIHAVETGLSSDPPMNWRLSALDGYHLISNSDAHSPAKLGREANLLDIELSYEGLYQAIQHGKGLMGTIEFFPEEGKYHYDGHRKCSICLSPKEAERYGGKCPVCGKKLTIGVSHRMEQLADRPEGAVREGAKPFESLVPLPEVLAASTGYSSASRKVQGMYQKMTEELGTEFEILRTMPLEMIGKHSGRLAAEGIRRLRAGKVDRLPGFDGEYGIIRLFEPWEIEDVDGQMNLFQGMGLEAPERKMSEGAGSGRGDASVCGDGSDHGDAREAGTDGYDLDGDGSRGSQMMEAAEEWAQGMDSKQGSERQTDQEKQETADARRPAITLNEKQLQAVASASRITAVIAGPGTGKTGTLTARILHLLGTRRVKGGEITAVTFTNKAAEEMRHRLKEALGGKQSWKKVQIGTFHSICLSILQELGREFVLAGEQEALSCAALAAEKVGLGVKPGRLRELISRKKSTGRWLLDEGDPVESGGSSIGGGRDASGDNGTCNSREQAGEAAQEGKTLPCSQAELDQALLVYQRELQSRGALDFDDLLIQVWQETKAGKVDCRPFSYLLVDEFQDINPIQYQLIREWNRQGRELFVIGDPDQAIYGFRGADPKCFDRLRKEEPEMEQIRLLDNYRSAPQILSAADAVISCNPGPERKLVTDRKREQEAPVRVVTASSQMAEAIFVAKEISRMVGGLDMLEAQEGFVRDGERKWRGFSDIAVLYRTHRQAELLERCFKQDGIPYVVAGREEFLAAGCVQGTLAFFETLRDPENRLALALCLKQLWGLEEDQLSESVYQAMCDKYAPLYRKTKPGKLLSAWMEELDLAGEEAMEKLLAMAPFYKTMEEFLDALSFGGESELKRCGQKTYTSGAVTLMTLHGSKGLEFPVVFLYGARNGMMPLDMAGASLEEERRLFFVGMTRAREELVITSSGEASPFLEAIPEADAVRETAGKSREKTEMRQMSLFEFMG
ncbi:MAG TPA: UvrD-helicase domain-containing protein [Candidatus Ventrimonas merdavium]|nr:UvrD-helicase domain-containing protein [Candidatus Ventrimonas merdavium]